MGVVLVGVRVDVNAMLGVHVGVIWGMGTKKRRYCTLYKKVLYDIKKIKKCGGRGGGAIFEPKTTLYVFKKEKAKKVKKKKLTETGLETTTSGLEIH